MEKDIDVFWVSKKGVVPYDKMKHSGMIWNFLYWKNGGNGKELLIVGDGNYNRDDASHKNLFACFSEYTQIIPNHRPDGAGNIIGSLTWKSTGFNVVTHDDLRPIIREHLGL